MGIYFIFFLDFEGLSSVSSHKLSYKKNRIPIASLSSLIR